MAQTWIERAKSRMHEMGISQQTLAQSLGSTRGAVGHYLSGRRNPNLQQIQIIAKKLQVHPAWLLYGQEIMEIREEQAAYSSIQAAQYNIPVTGTTVSGPGNVIEGQIKLTTQSNNCYALNIVGPDYSPRMYEGEAILIDPDLEPSPGDEVIIKSGNGVSLYTLINIRNQKITLNELNKKQARKVIELSDIQFIHCIVAVIRDNVIKRDPL